MNNKMVHMFVRTYKKKMMPAILALTSFLLILNILLAILISTTGIFDKSVTNNVTMKFMEIINNGSLEETKKIDEKLAVMDKVADHIPDYYHPVIVDKKDGQMGEDFNLIGMSEIIIKDLGITPSGEKYMYLPNSASKTYKIGDVVSVEEPVYKDNPKANEKPYEFKTFEFEVKGFYDDISWDVLPDDLAIIDKNSFEIITSNLVEHGALAADRGLAYIPNVADMKDVEKSITSEFPNVQVRYSLKNAGHLPDYAVFLVAVSGIIIAILFVFCFFNIRGNVSQILNQRTRDLGLLSLFGMEPASIRYVLVCEFFIAGISAFVLSGVVTFGLLVALYVIWKIDVFLRYMWIYLVIDLILAIVLFVGIACFEITSALKKINNAKIFKEILK